MNANKFRSASGLKCLACFVPLLLMGCSHTGTDRAGAHLQIGAAETDITPPIGFRMAGYFSERLATGTHDPLKAKALVLNDGKEQIALVFCDLIGMSLNVSTNARAKASQLTGIPISNIMICATHAHTGPLFDDSDDVWYDYFHNLALAKYGNDPHEPVNYPGFLIERLVQTITAAQSNLKPARLQAGIVQQENLTFNRRYWMKNGKVAFNPGQLNPNIVRPAGPADPDVGILLARNRKSALPFAAATVFAMHADVVGGTEYSADYAYFLEHNLRNSFGSNFISAFGAGCSGDLNHINVNKKEPFKGMDVAKQIGTTLGRTVTTASTNLPMINKPSFAVKSVKVMVPLQQPTAAQLADTHAKYEKLGDPKGDFFEKVIGMKILDLEKRGSPTWPMEVQVFRLDADTAIVCLPCEIFAELGLSIKQESPFRNTIVISICNDRPSYVPTRHAFDEGSYEVTNARVKPGAGEMLVDAAVKLLRDVKP